MSGITPESWPILVAFLVLQSVITIPLIRYIRTTHEAQLALLQKLYDASQVERDRLLKQVEASAEKMWRFADAMEEMRDAVRDIARERRTP